MKYLFQTLIILIFALAVVLRFFQLGTNPPSLDWDEASLGYNAYSILKTGRDEFGNFLPLSIRSFEDYKPAVYTYLTVVTVAIFGLSEFAVRLPSAILGSLTVLMVYFVFKEFMSHQRELTGSSKSMFYLPLLTMFFVAISPWHIQFSRVAFESNCALFFVLCGIHFFLKGIRGSKWLLAAALFFAISFYTYHSPRLVVPLLLMGWTVYFRKQLWERRKYVLGSILFGFVLLIPFIVDFTTQGKARFSSVTVLTPQGNLDESIKRIEYDQKNNDTLGGLLHNRRLIYAQKVIKGYLDHFNFDFLFLRGDAPDRHHARDMGMLYFWEFPFIIVGIFYAIRYKSFVILWWYLVAPVASALTTGTPHAVRALLLIPLYQFYTSLGFIWFVEKTILLKRRHIVFMSSFILVLVVSFFFYFRSYFFHTPIEVSRDWQYGYKEAVLVINKYTDVDKVIMTYAYDQPHVFVLFYNKIDPLWYQSQWSGGEVQRSLRGFGKYEFRNIEWEKDKEKSNVLLVGTPEEIPSDAKQIVAEIPFLNGKIAFRIVKL